MVPRRAGGSQMTPATLNRRPASTVTAPLTGPLAI
jgi:hypothetical protein